MKTYKMREDMLLDWPKDAVIAEVGVFMAEFSDAILNFCRPKMLHMIDMWKGSYWSCDTNNNYKLELDDMATVYCRLRTKYRRYRNVALHRGMSHEVMTKLSPKTFDAIYIDGDHRYPGVFSDLLDSERLVKDNGIIAGHDYNLHDVGKAVTDFCKSHDWKIIGLSEDKMSSFMITRIGDD